MQLITQVNLFIKFFNGFVSILFFTNSYIVIIISNKSFGNLCFIRMNFMKMKILIIEF